jgi:hypothetical protein
VDKGEIVFNIPYLLVSGSEVSITQSYINTYDSGEYLNDININGQEPQTGSYFTTYSGYTGFTFLGIGASRISEKKKYGSGLIENLPSGSVDGIGWTGYSFNVTGSIDNVRLYYQDRSDGITMITGETTNVTQESIIDFMLTRNEHFLGFVEEPRIYSDVFVERGKQGVMERNLRLGEIDNVGELNIYGNGFFKIKKQ